MSEFNFLFTNTLNGVIYGSLLLLPALGLNIVFGLGRVVNFAHGSFYALGAYVLFALGSFVGGYWLVLVCVPFVVMIVGCAIERLVIYPIRHRPEIDTLLVTFGLAFVLVGVIEYQWGTGTHLLKTPEQFHGEVLIFGNQFPIYRLVAAGISIAVSASVFAFIHATPVGVWIRAITDDAEMADAVGINTRLLLTVTFGAAVGLAGFGAALFAPVFALQPEMGLTVLIDSFLIVIVGGLGNLPGTVIAAFIVAITKSIGGGYIADWSTAITFAVVGILLVIRPAGIFNTGRVA